MENQEPKKKWFYKSPWFWVLVVIVLIIIGVANSGSQVASQSDVANACSGFSPSSAQAIDYSQLSKDPGSFKLTPTSFTGQILQIQESNGSGLMRLAVDKDSFGWNVSDVVLIDYSGHTDAVDNDVVTVDGIMEGSQTYTSTANFQITLPLMYACSISEASASDTSSSKTPTASSLTSAKTSKGTVNKTAVSPAAPAPQQIPAAPAQQPVVAAPPPTPSPITLTGSSQQATKQFTLQQGLSIFTLRNTGQVNFIVDLLDSNGNEVANIANVIGNFSGSQAVQIQNTGNYLLNVQSDGSWSITITQPRVNSAPSVSSLNGVSNQATQFFSLSAGLHTFNLTNTGGTNFIVDLLDQNGNEVDNLENVIGNFNGSTAVHIDNPGPYLLNIQSSGTWTITMQ